MSAKGNHDSNADRYCIFAHRVRRISGLPSDLVSRDIPPLRDIPHTGDPRRERSLRKVLDIERSRAEQPRVVHATEKKDEKSSEKPDYRKLLKTLTVPAVRSAPISRAAYIPNTRDPRRVRTCERGNFPSWSIGPPSLVENDLVLAEEETCPVLMIDSSDWPRSKHCWIEVLPHECNVARSRLDTMDLGDGELLVSADNANGTALDGSNFTDDLDASIEVLNASIEVLDASIEVLDEEETSTDVYKRSDGVTMSGLQIDDVYVECVEEAGARQRRVSDHGIIFVKEEPNIPRPVPRADEENITIVDLCDDEGDCVVKIEKDASEVQERASLDRTQDRMDVEVVTLDDDDEDDYVDNNRPENRESVNDLQSTFSVDTTSAIRNSENECSGFSESDCQKNEQTTTIRDAAKTNATVCLETPFEVSDERLLLFNAEDDDCQAREYQGAECVTVVDAGNLSTLETSNKNNNSIISASDQVSEREPTVTCIKDNENESVGNKEAPNLYSKEKEISANGEENLTALSENTKSIDNNDEETVENSVRCDTGEEIISMVVDVPNKESVLDFTNLADKTRDTSMTFDTVSLENVPNLVNDENCQLINSNELQTPSDVCDGSQIQESSSVLNATIVESITGMKETLNDNIINNDNTNVYINETPTLINTVENKPTEATSTELCKLQNDNTNLTLESKIVENRDEQLNVINETQVAILPADNEKSSTCIVKKPVERFHNIPKKNKYDAMAVELFKIRKKPFKRKIQKRSINILRVSRIGRNLTLNLMQFFNSNSYTVSRASCLLQNYQDLTLLKLIELDEYVKRNEEFWRERYNFWHQKENYISIDDATENIGCDFNTHSSYFNINDEDVNILDKTYKSKGNDLNVPYELNHSVSIPAIGTAISRISHDLESNLALGNVEFNFNSELNLSWPSVSKSIENEFDTSNFGTKKCQKRRSLPLVIPEQYSLKKSRKRSHSSRDKSDSLLNSKNISSITLTLKKDNLNKRNWVSSQTKNKTFKRRKENYSINANFIFKMPEENNLLLLNRYSPDILLKPQYNNYKIDNSQSINKTNDVPSNLSESVDQNSLNVYSSNTRFSLIDFDKNNYTPPVYNENVIVLDSSDSDSESPLSIVIPKEEDNLPESDDIVIVDCNFNVENDVSKESHKRLENNEVKIISQDDAHIKEEYAISKFSLMKREKRKKKFKLLFGDSDTSGDEELHGIKQKKIDPLKLSSQSIKSNILEKNKNVEKINDSCKNKTLSDISEQNTISISSDEECLSDFIELNSYNETKSCTTIVKSNIDDLQPKELHLNYEKNSSSRNSIIDLEKDTSILENDKQNQILSDKENVPENTVTLKEKEVTESFTLQNEEQCNDIINSFDSKNMFEEDIHIKNPVNINSLDSQETNISNQLHLPVNEDQILPDSTRLNENLEGGDFDFHTTIQEIKSVGEFSDDDYYIISNNHLENENQNGIEFSSAIKRSNLLESSSFEVKPEKSEKNKSKIETPDIEEIVKQNEIHSLNKLPSFYNECITRIDSDKTETSNIINIDISDDDGDDKNAIKPFTVINPKLGDKEISNLNETINLVNSSTPEEPIPSIVDELVSTERQNSELLTNDPKLNNNTSLSDQIVTTSTDRFTRNVNDDLNNPNILQEFNLSKENIAPENIKVELPMIENNEQQILYEALNNVFKDIQTPNEDSRINNNQLIDNTSTSTSSDQSVVIKIPIPNLQTQSNNSYDLLKDININLVDEIDEIKNKAVDNSVTNKSSGCFKLRDINELLEKPQNSSKANTSSNPSYIEITIPSCFANLSNNSVSSNSIANIHNNNLHAANSINELNNESNLIEGNNSAIQNTNLHNLPSFNNSLNNTSFIVIQNTHLNTNTENSLSAAINIQNHTTQQFYQQQYNEINHPSNDIIGSLTHNLNMSIPQNNQFSSLNNPQSSNSLAHNNANENRPTLVLASSMFNNMFAAGESILSESSRNQTNDSNKNISTEILTPNIFTLSITPLEHLNLPAPFSIIQNESSITIYTKVAEYRKMLLNKLYTTYNLLRTMLRTNFYNEMRALIGYKTLTEDTWKLQSNILTIVECINKVAETSKNTHIDDIVIAVRNSLNSIEPSEKDTVSLVSVIKLFGILKDKRIVTVQYKECEPLLMELEALYINSQPNIATLMTDAQKRQYVAQVSKYQLIYKENCKQYQSSITSNHGHHNQPSIPVITSQQNIFKTTESNSTSENVKSLQAPHLNNLQNVSTPNMCKISTESTIHTFSTKSNLINTKSNINKNNHTLSQEELYGFNTLCLKCQKPSQVGCSNCKTVTYCSRECQENHWKEEHYKTCKHK